MESTGVTELCSMVCLGGLLIVGFVVLAWILRRFMGSAQRPAGSYDSPDYDSGGSIGGMRGGRSYDHPDFDSGGTIGGARERRAHDSPDIDSGASIGGGPSVGKAPGRARRASSQPAADSGDGWEVEEKSDRYRTKEEDGRVDSPDFDSGGSFGG